MNSIQTDSAARTWGFTGLAAIAPISWGTTYLVTTEMLPAGIPLLSGAIRVLPAGLLLLLLARRLPVGVWWWRSIVLGTLNIGAFSVLLFVAAYRLPGGVAATLGAVQPLLVVGIAFLLLSERPSWWRIGWGIAGVVGVGLIVLNGAAAFDPVGIAAGLLGTTLMATGIVLTKRWGRPPGVGVVALTSWQLTGGGLLIAPVALAVEGIPPALDSTAIAGYAWLALIGTAVAYSLWFQGIGRLPVGALSFLPLLSPVVATLLGWAILDQSLTSSQGLGFALALTSIAAAQFTVSARRRARPPELRPTQESKQTIGTS